MFFSEKSCRILHKAWMAVLAIPGSVCYYRLWQLNKFAEVQNGMSELHVTLAHSIGPLVQLLSYCGARFFSAFLICAAAFWGERWLVRTRNRFLWFLPFLILMLGLFYGGLRVSGCLVYPSDGWDVSGIWNYTHQNRGAAVLFLCGCLLIGAVLAACKKKEIR